MGLFDKDALKKIEFLEREMKNIKGALAEASKRSPEYEKEAKNASKVASEFRNRSKETKEECERLLKDVKLISVNIEKSKNEVLIQKNTVNQELEAINIQKQEIEESRKNVLGKINEIEQKITHINDFFNEHDDIDSEITELENFQKISQETSSKISSLHKLVLNSKNEIDELYFEILGYEETDEETGEKEFVPGVKAKMESQINELTLKTKQLNDNIATIKKTADSDFEDYVKDKENKYVEIKDKIKSLLPDALTAGLSAAFSKKREDEEKAYLDHKKYFFRGIIGLIIVSLIPFYMSYRFMLNNDPLEIIINRIPRIVLAILPLYIPVLWLAFSSSKKMNLSKRLIEEYSHKEVLSKTYEGLSTQIENLDDSDLSYDLRMKLLQNFLEVYSENPGKLISNYDTSDHPIMEVLEKSYKLDSAIERLNKVPGIKKITNVLETRSQKNLDEKEEAISNILNSSDN